MTSGATTGLEDPVQNNLSELGQTIPQAKSVIVCQECLRSHTNV